MSISEHVLHAFQLEGEGVETSPAWDSGLRFGRVVVSPATETSVWSAKVREQLAGDTDGVRIARPVRATDGRLVVGGFAANEFAPGDTAARIDEAVGASLLIDDALHSHSAQPPTTARDTDVWADADRVVWADEETPPNGPGGVVANLSMLRYCLFDGMLPPTVTGFVPSVGLRPRGYTAAIVIVDGLLASAVDPGIVRRWAHIPRIDELVRKAYEFRAAGEASLDSNARANLRRVRELVLP